MAQRHFIIIYIVLLPLIVYSAPSKLDGQKSSKQLGSDDSSQNISCISNCGYSGPKWLLQSQKGFCPKCYADYLFSKLRGQRQEIEPEKVEAPNSNVGDEPPFYWLPESSLSKEGKLLQEQMRRLSLFDTPKLDMETKNEAETLKDLKLETDEKVVEMNRCGSCDKKLGIASRFDCRCGVSFCAKHRLPETHECTHDYKNAGRAQLQTQLPKVVADKLDNRI